MNLWNIIVTNEDSGTVLDKHAPRLCSQFEVTDVCLFPQ